jgi:hypothetical protein
VAVDARRAGNRLLLLAILVTLLLWNLPYGSYPLYPFKIFATWLHEGSHGLLMLLTGAGFDHMEIFRDTSGLAYPKSGIATIPQAIVSSSGYMGTAFFGALFLVLGRTERGSRGVLIGIGATMLLSAALFVRVSTFGVVATCVGGAAFVAAGFANAQVAAFLLNFVAAQSCINAVLDIRVLFSATMYVNGRPQAQSDAHTVAELLGGPPWMYAVIWLIWSFALFYGALRWMRLRGATSEHGAADSLAPIAVIDR